MNHRFKFRAFVKETKTMHEVAYIRYKEGVVIDSIGVWHNDGEYNAMTRLCNPDAYILMQCTGLKDKNDKLIYEGDIVIYKNYKYFVTHLESISSRAKDRCPEEFHKTGVIKRGEFGEYLFTVDDQRMTNFYWDLLEVRGTIYENKELLNE